MSLTIQSGGSITLQGGGGGGGGNTPAFSIQPAYSSVAITSGNVGTWIDSSGNSVSCTVTIGSSGLALVNFGAFFFTTGGGQTSSFMTFAVSGSNVRAASVQDSAGFVIGRSSSASNFGSTHSGQFLVSGLSQGTTTFTLKVLGLSDCVGKSPGWEKRFMSVIAY